MIREAFGELDNSRIDFSKELKFTARVGKEVHEYKPGTGNRTRKLAELLGKDKDDLVHWYETYEDVYVATGKREKRWKRVKSYSIESEPENLNLNTYKDLLLRKLKDSLEITGFDMVDLKRELLVETGADKTITPVLQLQPRLTIAPEVSA